MRRAKGVELTLSALRKTTQAAHLAQAGHAVTPARQNFVRIGLMAHIPHEAVLRGIKNVMQGNGELHRAEVGTQVPAGFADGFKHVGPQFVRQLPQLRTFQLAQVHRRLNGLQQRITDEDWCSAGFGFVGHLRFPSVLGFYEGHSRSRFKPCG